MGILFLTVGFESFWLTAFTAAFMGFCSIPVIPVSMDFVCEVAFPIGEATLSGILIMSGSLLSIINMVVINLGIVINNTKKHVYYMGYYTVALCLVGAVTCLFI
jgi:hypothetical protein